MKLVQYDEYLVSTDCGYWWLVHQGISSHSAEYASIRLWVKYHRANEMGTMKILLKFSEMLWDPGDCDRQPACSWGVSTGWVGAGSTGETATAAHVQWDRDYSLLYSPTHHMLQGQGVERARVNSLRPSDAYMRQQNIPSLIQIMACRLVGAKPSSEPIMDNW